MKSLNFSTGVVALDALVMLVGTYAATWALADLSYCTIEEPFLQMRRAYGGAVQAVTESHLAPLAGGSHGRPRAA